MRHTNIADFKLFSVTGYSGNVLLNKSKLRSYGSWLYQHKFKENKYDTVKKDDPQTLKT